MARATIPVDLFNPGQVFGCYGFLEAAEALIGGARGGFDWSDPAQTRFHLEVPGDAQPFAEVVRFLAEADVVSHAPSGSGNATEKWKVTTEALSPGAPFPFPDPTSPATLPAVLRRGSQQIVIDHWGDATQRDNVKFWAGSGGYPGVGLLRDALDLVRDRLGEAAADPFSVSAAQSGSFRFDWRRDYVPLGIGFSLNAHTAITPRGFPLVETMAAIGLAHARPHRPERRNKLLYRYAVLGGTELPPLLLRAGLGCSPLPFPTRTFRMTLSWPGQENQARCITDVVEEN